MSLQAPQSSPFDETPGKGVYRNPSLVKPEDCHPTLHYFPYLGQQVIYFDRQRSNGDPLEGRLATVVGEGVPPDGMDPDTTVQHVNCICWNNLTGRGGPVDFVDDLIQNAPMIGEGQPVDPGWLRFVVLPMPMALKNAARQAPKIVTAKDIPMTFGNREQRRAQVAKLRGKE